MDFIKKFCDISRTHTARYRAGRHRLGYHLMPLCGWMNDPHGPVWHDGAYHFFCNVYPDDADHPFAGKYWAHFTSENLVDFVCLPPAIAPDREIDKDGCASGCAVSHAGKLLLFYTARNRAASPPETQAGAISEDGICFVKTGDALIRAPGYGPDFRDPRLFSHADGWRMLLGNRDGERGRVIVYSSGDLIHWADEGVFCEKEGAYGFMWECPDYQRIDGRDYLILSPEGLPEKRHATGYFTGLLREDGLRFSPDEWHSLDEGRDFYAPQSFRAPDGRILLVAWMQKWFTDIPTVSDGWAGAVTIPRELAAGEDGLLEQRPARELLALRAETETLSDLSLAKTQPLRRQPGDQFELRLLIDLAQTTAHSVLLCAGGAQYRLDLQNRVLQADFSQTGGSPAPDVTARFIRPRAAFLELILFADRSSHELFFESGVTTITTRLYPGEPRKNLTLSALGGAARIVSFTLCRLRDARMDFQLTAD